MEICEHFNTGTF